MSREDISSILTEEQLQEFIQNGVLVVDGILNPSEVREAQAGLSRTLAHYGVDTNSLRSTGHNLNRLSSTNGSGGVLDIFYPGWKMNVATNERLFHATCQLWDAAYCHDGEKLEKVKDDEKFKWHPYGPFDCKRGNIYIDRIGYRIPSKIAEDIASQGCKASLSKKKKKRPIQRSLTPHLDCCPDTFNSLTNKSKFRPIQCFVSLTDNLEPNTGGFEAAPSFHRTFQAWAKSRPMTTFTETKRDGRKVERHRRAPCVGEYTHIRPREDMAVMDLVRHVPVRAGSAVFWDNRIPHANAYRNDGDEARAVVYCSFLPDVPLNKKFVRRQLENWKCRRRPTDQWIEVGEETAQNDGKGARSGGKTDVMEQNVGEEAYELTELGRKLMGIEDW